ncbi:MAG TPA: rhomboid family intramembrane serine protease [Steroidobacteraceae bacterium]|nr:rhomboid family intramembrane serine protease [Steroidobacteraceae bacterium]
MSVTVVLLGLIAVASLAGLTFAPVLLERSLFRPYWLIPKRQYATLISNGFMHANIAHLLFNMFTLWSFGRALEGAIGSERFLALYALGLLVSDAGTWLKHRSDPAYASLGASGAILAVLFASVVYFPTQSLYVLPLPVPIPAPWFALGYLAYTWYASRFLRGRVNHDAHFGGAITGLAFVALTDPRAWQRAISVTFH